VKQHPSIRPTAWALLISVIVLLAGSGNAFAHNGPGNNFNPYVPIFTQSQVKIAQTASRSFTSQLLLNAVKYQPLLLHSQTQVNMGFWSGPGNHGSLVRVLDSINVGCMQDPSPNCAVWDEGATSSEQYPAYVKMLEEHWYERGNAYGSPTVLIYGKIYRNKHPLDFPTADRIWGQYSQRYADMALIFYHFTGKPVLVWAFVQGASPTRIFYTYEYPELQKLEAEGVVKVYCADMPDANWANPNDWTLGTGSASCLPSAPVAGNLDEPVNVSNQ
jgi:hypothetical protein